MADVQLHPKLGVNPRLTCCRQCGADVGIALLGIRDQKVTCPHCQSVNYGSYANRKDKCGHCQQPLTGGKVAPIGEYEKLPVELCDACRKEGEEHAAIVAAGGVYFRCADCGAHGVIKADTPVAKDVRAASGIEPPNPVGVQFTKAECPKCRGIA